MEKEGKRRKWVSDVSPHQSPVCCILATSHLPHNCHSFCRTPRPTPQVWGAVVGPSISGAWGRWDTGSGSAHPTLLSTVPGMTYAGREAQPSCVHWGCLRSGPHGSCVCKSMKREGMREKRSHRGSRSGNCPENSSLSFGSPQQPRGFVQNGALQQHPERNSPSSDPVMVKKDSPISQKGSRCIAEVVLRPVWLGSRSSLTMRATKSRYRPLRLPRSIPRPVLRSLTAAVPHPGRRRAGVAEE